MSNWIYFAIDATRAASRNEKQDDELSLDYDGDGRLLGIEAKGKTAEEAHKAIAAVVNKRLGRKVI